MDSIRVIFTKRRCNLVSLGIRVLAGRSVVNPTISSHCVIVDGDYAFEAAMLYGVRRVPLITAVKESSIVAIRDYPVPYRDKGIEFANKQVGAKYDWAGAFSITVDDDRDWQDPCSWFCYELAAGILLAAGETNFPPVGKITEDYLLNIN